MSNSGQDETYFKTSCVQQYPLASKALVFLRHKCNPINISIDGFVNIDVVARWIKVNKSALIEEINKHDKEKEINYFEIRNNKIRAITCHSIEKVCEDLILEKVKFNEHEYGYVGIKTHGIHKFSIGDDYCPIVGRNCCVIGTTEMKPTEHHNIILVINLYELSKSYNVYKYHHMLFVRDGVPAKFIKCITLN
jgi:RNA:NAD 2'-phosphotransferase (TPT1/KptA family)